MELSIRLALTLTLTLALAAASWSESTVSNPNPINLTPNAAMQFMCEKLARSVVEWCCFDARPLVQMHSCPHSENDVYTRHISSEQTRSQ